MKRRIRFLILWILAVVFLFACETKQEMKRTSISILHGYGGDAKRDTKIREIYKEFERQNPDVSVNLISVPGFHLVEDRTKDLLAVGKVPNIVYMGGYSMDTLYRFMLEEEYLLDLMPYIREDEEFANSISQKNLQEWSVDGSIFTLTDNLSLRGYWYNKKIFQNAGITQVPDTKEEFQNACEKINAWALEERLNTVPLTPDAETAADIMQYRMVGKQIATKEYPLGGNRLVFQTALNELKELVGQNREARVYTKKDSFASFNIGHSAIYFGELWEGELFTKTMDAGFAFFPNDTQRMPMYSALSGYLISNLADDAQKEASVRFVKYMLAKNTQAKLLGIGMVPANPNVEVVFSSPQSERLNQGYGEFLQLKEYVLAPQKAWKGIQYTIFLEKVSSFLSAKISAYKLMELMQE